jgi:Domain of unknown function (DUF4260)
MEPEELLERGQVVVARLRQVEPEEFVAAQQVLDLLPVERCENAHDPKLPGMQDNGADALGDHPRRRWSEADAPRHLTARVGAHRKVRHLCPTSDPENGAVCTEKATARPPRAGRAVASSSFSAARLSVLVERNRKGEPALLSSMQGASKRFRTCRVRLAVKLDRMPRALVRLEGLAVLAAAVVVYVHDGYSLLAFFLLFLVPDVSFLGYLGGPRMGSIVYNAVHTYLSPLALGIAGVLADGRVPVQVALIWVAHIGFDRALGYGLKYPTAFKDTHLRRL